MKPADSADLYPGKRYLNLDLNLKTDSIFTDTIFNLPTPTEDVIPIIITANTPTASVSSTEEDEDLHRLRPPNSNLIPAEDETNTSAKLCLSRPISSPVQTHLKDPKKPPPPDINSIPRPRILKNYLEKIEANVLQFPSTVAKKTASAEIMLAKGSASTLAEELLEPIEEVCFKSSLSTEDEADALCKESQGSINSERENNEIVYQHPETSVASTFQDQATLGTPNENISEKLTNNSEPFSNDISCSPPSDTESNLFASPKTSFFVDDISVLNNLKATTHSCSEIDSSSVLEEVNGKSQKLLTNKSKDDSSSSDEFLESIRQPLNYSEDSSTATSSLELM